MNLGNTNTVANEFSNVTVHYVQNGFTIFYEIFTLSLLWEGDERLLLLLAVNIIILMMILFVNIKKEKIVLSTIATILQQSFTAHKILKTIVILRKL